MLPRLLGLVTIFIVLMTLVRALAQAFGRPRHPEAHRPRDNASGRRTVSDIIEELFGRVSPVRNEQQRTGDRSSAGSVAIHLVRPEELAGVRDAFSSAPLDPSQPLHRCEGCASFYQAASRQALVRENGGHCVVCQGTRLGSVRLVDPAH
jgi:hypothetical protein